MRSEQLRGLEERGTPGGARWQVVAVQVSRLLEAAVAFRRKRRRRVRHK